MKAFLALTLAVAVCATNAFGNGRLINGTPIEPGKWREVVRIRTGNSACTATVVGPRVLTTAAHCGSTNATSVFSIEGKQYQGTLLRSGLYASKDHDQAVIVLNETVVGQPLDFDRQPVGARAPMTIQPAVIAPLGTAKVGLPVWMLGYGCTQPGGGGGNDGVLREGGSRISGFSGFDAVLKEAGGAAACFGDSGGPTFTGKDPETRELLLTTSKGNIKDTSYNSRLDIEESRKFHEDVIAKYKVDICGVNKTDCRGPVKPQPKSLTVQCSGVKVTVEHEGIHEDDYVRRATENLCLFLSTKATKADGVIHLVQPIEEPPVVNPVQPLPPEGN